MKKTKVNALQNGLENLPPRVIIHDILSFHVVDLVDDSEEKPYQLFGYFLKDRLRNIWFVFRSLSFFEASWDCKALFFGQYIDFERIIFLTFFCQYDLNNVVYNPDLNEDSEDFVNDVILHSCHMKSLQGLHIISENYCLEDLFSKTGSFPALKSLKVNFGELDSMVIDNWTNATHIFKNLTTLHIDSQPDCARLNHFKGLFDKCSFENIKSLTLYYFTFSEVYTLNLPNVEKLFLFACEKLRIEPGKKLRKASLLFVDANLIYHFCRTQRNLKDFAFSRERGHLDYNRIFNNENNVALNKLEKLELKYLVPLKIEPAKPSFSYGENIVELIIDQCNGFYEKSFLKPYPRLRKLTLKHIKNICGSEKWSFAHQLWSLVVVGGDEDIFRKNEFTNLEHLELWNRESNGKKWNPLTSLKSLKLCCSEELLDEISCPNLEKLHLVKKNLKRLEISGFNSEIKGENWIFLENLEMLIISDCRVLRSDFEKKDVCFVEQCEVRIKYVPPIFRLLSDDPNRLNPNEGCLIQ